jgi:hypothetical protein
MTKNARVVNAKKALEGTTDHTVNHPLHYHGAEDPYETIKVIEAWGLNFHLGNAVKYISRCDMKGNRIEDLKKAAWYLQREIDRSVN